MHPKQAVALGIRLFVIWSVVTLLRYLPNGFGFFEKYVGEAYGLWLVGISAVVSVVVFLILWFFPLTVAGMLLPGAEELAVEGSSPEEWFVVGYRLLGLWVLTQSIPGLFFYYVPLAILMNSPGSMVAWDPNINVRIAYMIAELAIGIWLLFGAKGLRGMLRLARTAGH